MEHAGILVRSPGNKCGGIRRRCEDLSPVDHRVKMSSQWRKIKGRQYYEINPMNKQKNPAQCLNNISACLE